MAKQNIKGAQIYMKSKYDSTAKEYSFQVGDQVYIRDTMKQKSKNPKFLPKYRGPFLLTKQLSPVTFEFDNSRHDA